MSAQKTLSQISLAAVALLVVALPSFAQTETDRTSAASATDNSTVVAVNRESESRVDAKRVSSADTTVKAPKFSAHMFVKPVNEPPAVTIKSSSVFRPATPKFNTSDSARRVTFVPSTKPAAPGVTQ